MTHITDSNGRRGVITEIRPGGVFARPENEPYVRKDEDGLTGVKAAQLITATYWTRRADGTYTGCWYDSPYGARLEAVDDNA